MYSATGFYGLFNSPNISKHSASFPTPPPRTWTSTWIWLECDNVWLSWLPGWLDDILPPKIWTIHYANFQQNKHPWHLDVTKNKKNGGTPPDLGTKPKKKDLWCSMFWKFTVLRWRVLISLWVFLYLRNEEQNW